MIGLRVGRSLRKARFKGNPIALGPVMITFVIIAYAAMLINLVVMVWKMYMLCIGSN